MRIIGGKDYYDSAIAYGIDPGIVFVRDSRKLDNGQMDGLAGHVGISLSLVKTEDVNKFYTERKMVSADRYHNSRTIDGVKYFLQEQNVIFCGKIYRGLILTEWPKNNEKVVTTFWSLSKLQKWAADRDMVVKKNTSFWNRAKEFDEDPFTPQDLPRDEIDKMIEINASILIQTGEPDTSIGKGRIGWAECDSGWIADCDILKDIGFQSALDPYSAFQELAMWVGGTLATNGPNTVTITDNNVKIAKHGFDKFSFRKPKA